MWRAMESKWRYMLAYQAIIPVCGMSFLTNIYKIHYEFNDDYC